jgi:hypothetical protein
VVECGPEGAVVTCGEGSLLLEEVEIDGELLRGSSIRRFLGPGVRLG